MTRFLISAAMLPIMALTACGSQSGEAPADDVDAPAATEPGEVVDSGGLILDSDAADGATLVESAGNAASFDADCVISETGAAGIDMPATTGDFVEAFPAGTGLSFQPVYMVDFGALCARSGGEDALCVIFESYDVEEYRADIPVMAMGVYANQCRTAEGVGPGSSIVDAVAAYGAARFGFSYENEAREYVSFESAPDAYSFRAESEAVAADPEGNQPSGRYGGDYTGVEGDSYFETNVAQPDATLWEIWISTPL
ncbi:hypothetical protein HFP51_05310 [Parasphingopyxis sp. CP4]|uniref:hypothetical protein n=1 Tax=Parasphingopyxis sp. CP4 TaxID=2724527 RepID=UPI0015A4C2CD|nr:hypothetical protein [Parasphingopyxis sp. CP4]QLC21644.1 hypothetical protein HFP51_05310 [Parasphingopyxis sp. CP4]